MEGRAPQVGQPHAVGRGGGVVRCSGACWGLLWGMVGTWWGMVGRGGGVVVRGDALRGRGGT